MERRGFLVGCGVLAAAARLGAPGRAAASEAVRVQPGPRALLLYEGRTPLRTSRVVPHRSYVFLYPFQGTPCFLLDLGQAVPGMPVPAGSRGSPYGWSGGVGPNRSLVAFSAICPHAFTHPTPDVAMIHYYGPDAAPTVAQQGRVITCCVHGSTFDPTRGAVPLQPPAEDALAGIALEWNEPADELYAYGVVGRPVFEEFFRSYPKSTRQEVQGGTPVWELERYSRAVLSC